MSEEYKIEKIGDLLDIPTDVLVKFCDELKGLIIPVKEQYELLKMLGETKKGSDVMPSITYVDDNKRDVTINVKIEKEK